MGLLWGGRWGETISFPSPHPGVGGMQLLSPDAPADSQLPKAWFPTADFLKLFRDPVTYWVKALQHGVQSFRLISLYSLLEAFSVILTAYSFFPKKTLVTLVHIATLVAFIPIPVPPPPTLPYSPPLFVYPSKFSKAFRFVSTPPLPERLLSLSQL